MPVAQTTIVVAAITTAGVVFVVVWVIALLSGLSKLLTKKNPDGDDDYSVFEREIPDDDNNGNGGGYAGENATTNDDFLSGYDEEPAPKPRRMPRYSPPQTTFTPNPSPTTDQDWQQQIARAQQTQLDKTLTLSFPKFDWDDENEVNPQSAQGNAAHNKPKSATTAHNNAATRLQHILDSRKGLRAAILASEILGTPKSLRENPDPWEPR
ncbi:MAG: hypothetical protein LUD52_00310 [Opitutae bacterium]|nr:hypothetical protein [Opitutae bacterium]